MERRYQQASLAAEEQRVGTDPPYQVLRGYAAVFYNPDDPGSEFELWNYGDERCVERILPEAFDQFLVPQVADGIDCCALYNHNPDHLLGRQSAGTLTLSKDSKGLMYSITPPESPLGKGIIASVQRGDLKGSSFSFDVDADGQRWTRQGGLTVREILRVSQLVDVGPVVFPAYQSTTAGVSRSPRGGQEHTAEARAAWEAWHKAEIDKRDGEQQRGQSFRHLKLRLRLAEID